LSARFGNFSHLTKVGQVHLSTQDIFTNNQMPAFMKMGVDPLTEMIRFAHSGRKAQWLDAVIEYRSGSRR
jgi:hypothetical protein